MLTILLYISLIAGGILVLMLFLSLFAGLDLDIDIDVDSGGLGITKAILAFLSIGSYVVRSVLMTSDNPLLAFSAGIFAGLLTVAILSYFLKWLISNQEEVNYENTQAEYKKGTVYLKIPKGGQGIIQVKINGVMRELKAITEDKKDIETGAVIFVESVENNIAKVTTDF